MSAGEDDDSGSDADVLLPGVGPPRDAVPVAAAAASDGAAGSPRALGRP